MNIESTKIALIKAIAEANSERMFDQAQHLLEQLRKHFSAKEEDPLAIARKPTPKTVSLEQLKKEQGYDVDKMNEHFRDIDRSLWEEEDIHELLKEI